MKTSTYLETKQDTSKSPIVKKDFWKIKNT